MDLSPMLDPLSRASDVRAYLEAGLGEVLLLIEWEKKSYELMAFDFQQGRVFFHNLSTESLSESLQGLISCREEEPRVESMSLKDLHQQMEAGVVRALLVDIDTP